MVVFDVIALLVIIAVSLFTWLFQKKGETRWYVYVPLQVIGLVTLLSFNDYSVMVVGGLYTMLFMLASMYWLAKTERLVDIPLYIFLLTGGFLFINYISEQFPLKFESFFDMIVSEDRGFVLMAVLASSSIGAACLNAFSKRHSVLLYVLAAAALLYSTFLLIFYYTFTVNIGF